MTPTRTVFCWIGGAALALGAAPALALNILVCNDDGLTAANVRTLKQRLVAAGHSVAVTAPLDNQSGYGGYISFLRAVPPATGKERGAIDLALPPGAPGIGQDRDDVDVHYVNGSPVMACLYGLDVVAQRKWKGPPDLVVSGPNEGNNTGLVNNSSGTFANLLYAINRGLPALALSHASARQVKWQADLPAAHPAWEVADIGVRLIAALLASRPPGGPLVPAGVGLNVNVPVFAEGAAKSLPFRMTRIGTASDYAPAFIEGLASVPAAAARGAKGDDAGVTFAKGGDTLPSGSRMPRDADPDSENNVLELRNAITVTPVEGVPEARPALAAAVRAQLAALLRPVEAGK